MSAWKRRSPARPPLASKCQTPNAPASLIMALLMRNTPKDVRIVLIDPKRVEFTLFEGVPHLMCPVVKDVKQAPGVLRALWREMDRRYDVFSEAGVRNIDGWNA